MLKELQEKIKLEIERMQNKLVDSIKTLLNEEIVLAKVSEDLGAIDVIVRKNKEEEDGRFFQQEYVFIYGVNEKGELNTGVSTSGSVVLLQGGRVIGTYATPVFVDTKTMNLVFATIEKFRAEELNTQKGEEAAPAE